MVVKFLLQVISVMSMWTRVQPAYAANMWNEALNKRLGTEVLCLLLDYFIFFFLCL